MPLFQIIDVNKTNCPMVYSNGKFSDTSPSNVTRDMKKTWSYSSILENVNVEYAKLYCNGKSLDEVCPLSLKPRWSKISKKLNAFYTSLKESKANYNEVCLMSLIPEEIFKEYCDIKNKICEHVFKVYPRPKNYEFMLDLTKLTLEIANRELNVEGNYPKHILYNPQGTIHGRLTTFPGSFPILTLNKKNRDCLSPVNNFFLSLDYNSAELRTLNILLGKENINEDLHNFNIKHIFQKDMSRDDAKKEFFAWLYNPAYSNEAFEKYYNRNILLEKYFCNGKIENPFGRIIECDKYHAINYLVSSTLTDLFLRQCIKVNKFLKEQKAKSFIAFMIHDNLMLDCDKDEKEIIKKTIDIFGNTCYNIFMMSKKIGKNFGEMKEI